MTFYKKEEESLRNLTSPMLLETVHKIKFRIKWSATHLMGVVEWMKNNTI